MLGDKKKRKFVVMDGSDKRFMKEVTGVVEMVTGKTRWFNRVRPRALDRNHPTMKVITVKSGYRYFDAIRHILERDYPEQCVFDVVL